MPVSAGFDLAIFDCDGVLVDSEPIANRVFVEELRAEGLTLTESAAGERFTGLTLARCLELAEESLGRRLPAGFAERLQSRTFDAFRSELRPVPGVHEVVRALEILYCVASSGAPEKIRFTLGLTGLLPHFEGRIFSATEVARGKPAPDLFLRVAESFGVAAARCAVIEDSLPGVLAGQAAGMTVFGYAARAETGELSAAGAIEFRSMDDLRALLDLGPRR